MFSTSVLTASVVYLLAFNAQLGLALTVTSPEEGQSWNSADSLKVEWSSVSTDAQTFDIQISNQDTNTYPTGFTQTLQKDVKTSDGSATINPSEVSGLKVGSGYRISLIADSNNNAGILAQSQPFNVTGSSSSSGNTTTTVTGTTGTTNTTRTVPTNTTGSSSGVHNTSSSSTHPMSTNSSSTIPNAAHSGCSFLRPDQMSMLLGVVVLISVMVV